MGAFIKDFWKLVRPYWASKERWVAGGLLGIIVLMNLGEVYLNVLFNQWNKGFYDSLQAVDQKAFVHALIRFSYLAAIFIANGVYKTYLNQNLNIKWRTWLTHHYLGDWLAKQNYYRMQLLSSNRTDNPDQRISDDIGQLVSLSLDLSLGLLSAVVTLGSFLTILWHLSGPLLFDIGGTHIVIPGYMVWAALGYAIVGTWLTMKIGRPLVRLSFDQQRYEADFRFSLIRLRENSESIAFYKGEAQEQHNFVTRFGAIVGNYWQIMKRQKALNWFTSGYQQIAIIFPFVVAAPRFFAKQIQLGDLMQTASAFGQVQGSLSYIINSYLSIADLRAVINRLTGFNQSVHQAAMLQSEHHPSAQTAGMDAVIADDLTIQLPNGQILLEHINLNIQPCTSLLITGPSGSGKSTLLRTLSGIWPFFTGKLLLPDMFKVLFVPQKSYLPLGTLREVLCYPNAPDKDDAKLIELMSICQLTHLVDKVNDQEQWSQILSLGEQQRISFVRILLAKPEFIFLDEATSAMDASIEARCYRAIKEQLPKSAIVSVGHHESLRAWHKAEMTL
jgi:putative ATP-binding cassette transporter